MADFNPRYKELAMKEGHKVSKIFGSRKFIHIGSTAIKGMIGKPSIDLCIIKRGVLPYIPNELVQKMSDIGYVYYGPAPHNMNKHQD